MAIHDVDKTNHNRIAPQPNVRDLNGNRLAHGTTGFTLTQEDTDSTLGKLIVKDGRLILVRENNTFVDLSNGNIEIMRETGGTLSRQGYRPADSTSAVDIAKPGETV